MDAKYYQCIFVCLALCGCVESPPFARAPSAVMTNHAIVLDEKAIGDVLVAYETAHYFAPMDVSGPPKVLYERKTANMLLDPKYSIDTHIEMVWSTTNGLVYKSIENQEAAEIVRKQLVASNRLPSVVLEPWQSSALQWQGYPGGPVSLLIAWREPVIART